MSLLGTLNLDDVPIEKVRVLSGNAICGELTQKEISNGYVQVSLPLHYQPSDDPTNGVDSSNSEAFEKTAPLVTDNESAKAIGLKTFIARFNIKPEWLTPEFSAALRAGQVDEKEKQAYNINVPGLARGLFRAIGSSAIDFSTNFTGKVIGFKAAGSKSEPDRAQVRLFYPAKKG